MKVYPPSLELREDDAIVERTEKSDATPVVEPKALDTLIVQTMLNPVRDGEVFVHSKLESFVGLPYTTKVDAPMVIALGLLVD